MRLIGAPRNAEPSEVHHVADEETALLPQAERGLGEPAG